MLRRVVQIVALPLLLERRRWVIKLFAAEQPDMCASADKRENSDGHAYRQG